MVDSADMMTFDAKVGNPWSILPIKNKKYAKDLVEVHLSDRSLNSLTNFESFPNLEVIWLNNNAVSQLISYFMFRISVSMLIKLLPIFSVTEPQWHCKQFPCQRALLSEQLAQRCWRHSSIQVPAGASNRRQPTSRLGCFPWVPISIRIPRAVRFVW